MTRRDASHPAALTIATIAALARATTRELRWGLKVVSREVASWRALAARIPDDTLRQDALDAIDRKRPHIDGAALFSTLPRERSPELLRLLVAYDMLGDFLDNCNERGGHVGLRNGLQLHGALVEALEPVGRPIADYYIYHPWSDDGGYVRALVEECRWLYARLPSHDAVAPLLAAYAPPMARALSMNHDSQPDRRDERLRSWAATARGFPANEQFSWFERTACYSSWLPMLGLFALASEQGLDEHTAQSAMSAYFPWVAGVSAILDGYADADDDRPHGGHNYIDYYPTDRQGAERIAQIVAGSIREVASIPDGSPHLVILGCMVAMFLSKDRPLSPRNRAQTAMIVREAGPLVEVLAPILRTWRRLYGLGAA